MSLCGNGTFWDWQTTVNASWPRLPACFQQTVLILVPTGFLWIASPFYLLHLVSSTSRSAHAPHSILSKAKTAVSLLLSCLTLTATLKDVASPPPLLPPHASPPVTPMTARGFLEVNTSYLLSRGVELASFILTVFLVQVDRCYCVMTSGLLFIFWFLSTIASLITFYTYIEVELYIFDLFRFAVMAVSWLLVVVQLLLHCPADVKLFGSHLYCNAGVCPELTASFLSKITFFWMTRLIYTGYKRPLQSCDLWPLNSRDNGETVQRRLYRAWPCAHGSRTVQRNHERYKNDERALALSRCPQRGDDDDLMNPDSKSRECSPLLRRKRRVPAVTQPRAFNQSAARSSHSLTWTLIRAFGWEVGLSYGLKFLSDCLQFTAPFLLKSLIIFIETRDSHPGWQGYFLAGAMLVTSLLQSLFYHQHYHLAMTSGMRMKSALMAAVYRKSLCLDPNVRGRYSSGEVINLMSVDCQRVQDVMSYTWMFWSIPFQVSLAVYLLWGTLGVPVLAGMALLLLLVPINGLMAYVQQKLQRTNLEWKDKRIRMLSEVLTGIKVIKLYAWEDTFLRKILALRGLEVVILTRLAWLTALGVLVWTCAPYLVCLASFGAFVLLQPEAVLTADAAFVTLALFNILQFPIAFIPEMVSFASQARVSIKRINEYLCQPERHNSKDNALNSVKPLNGNLAIRLTKAAFAWDTGASFKLSGLTLDIPRGSLVAIVGPVCSGKSSLLAALLGEMKLLQGDLEREGSTAYVPQEAWLQNASIKDNILFGTPCDAQKYKSVLADCALGPDLEGFLMGDNSEVGEKGVNLSGGQKQRVSLARAVYADCDVYFLDDPLSAVDTAVGKHLFKRVLSHKGCLKHKTRLLVTHGVHWLPLTDLVLVMQEGRLVEHGSYRKLTSREGPLTHFLWASLSKDMDEGNGAGLKEDPEILEIKRRMWEHVESATSQSDATTSGDDIMLRQRRFQEIRAEPGTTPSRDRLSTSTDTVIASQGEAVRTPVDDVSGDRKSSHASVMAELSGQEDLKHGNVNLSVYASYCKNVGLCSSFTILLVFTLYQCASVLANVWLSKWTSDVTYTSSNATTSQVQRANVSYITIYAVFGVAQVVLIFIYACLSSLRMVAASSSMHRAMLTRVMGAPLALFDSTPSGRILNRCSRDVETLDNNLPQVLFMWVLCVFSVGATVVVIAVQTPLFVAVAGPLFAGYWAIQRFFVPTSRQVKRREAITRTPIFVHFAETLAGSHVIRAFRRQHSFMADFRTKLDKNLVMYFAGITANRWLGVWVEGVSSLVVMATSVFSLITPGINGSTLGLSVTYALQITQALKWLVRTMSDIETNAVSVERVHEYSFLQQEVHTPDDVTPSVTWPDNGQIAIRGLTVRYKDHLEPVLENFTCHIEAGEKIAVVGRTGAGKSSLTLSLFRILEAETGDIIIDGINIASLGLRTLRSRITILPQDPTILTGSLRMNLDPENLHSDDDLWRALTLAHLKDTTVVTSAGLESDVGEHGAKMSTGQRQLLCLARALLRHSHVVVMDEATSCVDLETDAMIQDTVRTVFGGCTVITIAHRLHTVMGYDRVMVLQAGRIVEFDTPMTLLKDTNSHFSALCKSAGYRPSTHLLQE